MSKTSSFVASSTCKQSPSPPRRTLPRSRSQTLLNHGGTTGWPNLNPYFSPRRNYTSCIHLRKMNVSIFLNRIPHVLFFFFAQPVVHGGLRQTKIQTDRLETELWWWRNRCRNSGKKIPKRLVQARAKWAFHKEGILDFKVC